LAWLKALRRDTQEIWATEGFIGESMEQGALQNAKALGGISVIDKVGTYICIEEEIWMRSL
jgi:hypothetical protein